MAFGGIQASADTALVANEKLVAGFSDRPHSL
jgi:hypothetical protein